MNLQDIAAKINFGIRALWGAIRELAQRQDETTRTIAQLEKRVNDLELALYNLADGLEHKDGE